MAKRFGYKGKYESTAHKNGKKAMPLLFLVAGIALLCLISGIAAKYIQKTDDPGNQVGAKDFYFTVDLFAAEGEEDENRIVEKRVDLFGAGQRELYFTVQNFFDELRVNSDEIEYTVSYTTSDGLTATVHEPNASLQSGPYKLTGGTASERTFVITATGDIPDEGAEVVVTIQSTAPYNKTMVLTVGLNPQEYDVLYRLEDEPATNSAKLIIMAGKRIQAGELLLDWSAINASGNVLQIDSTNGIFLPDTTGGYAKTATNTKEIEEGASIAIYFFKLDPSINYMIGDTVAQLSGGKYQVVITQ